MRIPVHSLLAALLGMIACQGPTGIEDKADDGTCRQTYEFGNFGCAEITGQVLGSSDQPLTAASIVIRDAPDPNAGYYGNAVTQTNAAGLFRVRVTRLLPRPIKVVPDTFSIYVLARVIHQFGAPPWPPDSALVQVELAPIGAIPKATEVQLRLPFP